MKKLALLSAGLIALAASASAAPTWVLGEGALIAGNDHKPVETFAMFTTIPAAVSATDMASTKTAFLIDGSVSTFHDGSPMVPTAFLDGLGEVNYPGNIPADRGAPSDPVGEPCLSLGIDLGGTVDVGSVIVYAYAQNNDVRGVAPYSVYTTTDATPSATGTWTKIIDYTSPDFLGGANWYDAEPDNYDPNPDGTPNFWDPYISSFDGTAMVCADNVAGVPLAAGITGIRIDVMRTGNTWALRHPTNSAASVQAFNSPYIAEIDVLDMADTAAFFTGQSGVVDWTLWH